MNYYSGNIDNDTSLKLSPLTNVQASMVGSHYGDVGGYFLYRTKISDPQHIEVLAQVPSDEAAFQLSRLLGLD